MLTYSRDCTIVQPIGTQRRFSVFLLVATLGIGLTNSKAAWQDGKALSTLQGDVQSFQYPHSGYSVRVQYQTSQEQVASGYARNTLILLVDRYLYNQRFGRTICAKTEPIHSFYHHSNTCDVHVHKLGSEFVASGSRNNGEQGESGNRSEYLVGHSGIRTNE